MKNIIILFLIISVNYIHAQELKINWETKPKNGEIQEIELVDSTHFFIKKIINPKKAIGRKFEFNLVELKSKKPITNSGILPYSSFDIYNNSYNLIVLNNKPNWYKAISENKETNFYLFPLSESFEESSDKLLIGNVASQAVFGSYINVNFEDKLFFFSSVIENEIAVRVTNVETKEISFEKRIPLPTGFENIDLICQEETENGEFIFLFRPSKNPRLVGLDNDPIKGESNKLFFIYASKEETHQSTIELPENLFIQSGDITTQSSNIYIQLIGKNIDIENDDNNAPVIVSLKWDPTINEASVKSISDFTKVKTDFLKSEFGFNCSFTFHSLNDGAFIGIAQRYHGVIDEDIIVFKVDKNGEIIEKKGIPYRGKGFFIDNFSIANGGHFSYIDENNNLILIMNENKKNFDKNGNYIAGVSLGINAITSNEVTEIIKIDLNSSDLQIERSILKGLGENEFIYPSFTQKLSETEYLLYKSSEDIDAYGILTID